MASSESWLALRAEPPRTYCIGISPCLCIRTRAYAAVFAAVFLPVHCTHVVFFFQFFCSPFSFFSFCISAKKHRSSSSCFTLLTPIYILLYMYVSTVQYTCTRSPWVHNYTRSQKSKIVFGVDGRLRSNARLVPVPRPMDTCGVSTHVVDRPP